MDELRAKIAAIIQEEPDLQGPSGVPRDSASGMAARILDIPEIKAALAYAPRGTLRNIVTKDGGTVFVPTASR